ncbi:MAG: SDR family oxidoreductase [Giesbergeria sp.]|nr:SDR family oxidoreductase [Giesbergeria sp.]MBP6159428.1 SDR family oxidoreductase [Giesbergeria sp.]MBP7083932.1 SDR family oxidoreductase [Giesbergeria sp.]MBP9783433.1 SDR family oxidoreductase [Giesbergeria sp.]MBP9896704.1 SDR family oxidoreductase [Giesbergeria sp.]
MSLPDRPKAVLVTGGARRLGKAFCLAFARAGWNVVCHYQHSGEEALQTCEAVRALGRDAYAVPGDLGRPEAIEEMFSATVAALGQAPDAIVNNASAFEPDSGVDFSPALLHTQMQVNLAAPLQLASLLARSISAATATAPCVIHVLDQKVFNLNPDYFSYTLSKLALERAVALQAQALAPHVRVNGVAPGLIYVSGPQSDENFDRARSVNLLQSATDPADVARTAVFLAENPSITGVTIAVDKGQHLVPLAHDIMFVAEQLGPAAPQGTA